ncbi:MAG: glutamate-1-semialdehyde 2,1-aminomutase [Candidatus Zixiibacteriota bacterium]
MKRAIDHNNAMPHSRQEQASPHTQVLQQRLHALIPGGAHTYAKGDDQYPANAPACIVRGQGCHVWDPDGREFIEYGMGLRAVTLGHAYPSVVEAAYRQMKLGENYTRPGIMELTCAEKFLECIPNAEMVKFCKNGSDATSAAVKLSRAYTGRNLVAICKDQPFFSIDDWFIGSTAMNAGIPQAIRDLTVGFHFNDIESVKTLFAKYPNQIACLILEAETSIAPKGEFLVQLQDLCRAHGVVFILDEMITGFRWHLSGAQHVYGLKPDLCTFGKGLGNGFAVSALAGRSDIMQRGGIHHDKERVFLLSTTHGAEQHALAAAVEIMRIYKEEKVTDYLHQQGEKLRTGLNKVIDEIKLNGCFEILGRNCNLVFATRDPNKQPSQPYRTLFMQEMVKRGFLTPSLVISFSHGDDEIARTITAVGESLVVYKKALEEGYEKYLIGQSVKPVMRPYC